MQVGKHGATHANKCKKTRKTMICSHIFANFARKTLPLASRNISHVVVNKHT